MTSRNIFALLSLLAVRSEYLGIDRIGVKCHSFKFLHLSRFRCIICTESLKFLLMEENKVKPELLAGLRVGYTPETIQIMGCPINFIKNKSFIFNDQAFYMWI